MRGNDKKRTDALGFGAVTLYCLLIVFIAGGVYGFDDLPLLGGRSSTESASDRPVKGKMLVATEDRVRCRQYSFDNETQQVTPGDLTFCDDHWKALNSTPPAIMGIRDAFRKR